jgi:hypothetical protein
MLAVPNTNLSSTRIVCVTESGSAAASAPRQMAVPHVNHNAPATANAAVAGTGARDQRRIRRQERHAAVQEEECQYNPEENKRAVGDSQRSPGEQRPTAN